MSKALILSGLAVFLVVLLLPVFTFAQPQSNECCQIISKLKWDVTGGGATLGKKCIIGAKDGYCVIDGGVKTLGTELGIKGCSADEKTEEIKYSPQWGTICIVNTVNNVTNWLFYLMSAVAVLLFIVGGIFYMTAGGDPDKAKKGKSIIIYAIIGLAIALVAKMIPSLVKTVIG